MRHVVSFVPKYQSIFVPLAPFSGTGKHQSAIARRGKHIEPVRCHDGGCVGSRHGYRLGASARAGIDRLDQTRIADGDVNKAGLRIEKVTSGSPASGHWLHDPAGRDVDFDQCAVIACHEQAASLVIDFEPVGAA